MDAYHYFNSTNLTGLTELDLQELLPDFFIEVEHLLTNLSDSLFNLKNKSESQPPSYYFHRLSGTIDSYGWEELSTQIRLIKSKHQENKLTKSDVKKVFNYFYSVKKSLKINCATDLQR